MGNIDRLIWNTRLTMINNTQSEAHTGIWDRGCFRAQLLGPSYCLSHAPISTCVHLKFWDRCSQQMRGENYFLPPCDFQTETGVTLFISADFFHQSPPTHCSCCSHTQRAVNVLGRQICSHPLGENMLHHQLWSCRLEAHPESCSPLTIHFLFFLKNPLAVLVPPCFPPVHYCHYY